MAWTAPRTWVSGETLTAALANQHWRDNLKAIGDAWSSYTPTLGGWTLGNGTLTGDYINPGKLFSFCIKLTIGSTTTFAGGPTFTLPVTAVATRTVVASALFFDTSATAYHGGWGFNNNTTTLLCRSDASASITSTVPFTWTTGDELVVTGTGETA